MTTNEGRCIRFKHNAFEVDLTMAKMTVRTGTAADRGQVQCDGMSHRLFFAYLEKGGIKPKYSTLFVWSTGQPAGDSFTDAVRHALPGATFELVGEPKSVDEMIDRRMDVKAAAAAASSL